MPPKTAQTIHVVEDFTSVFALAARGIQRMDMAERSVSIRRMQCFAVKGTTCVTCGRKGNILMLDKWPDGSIHLDLFSLTDGERVLMNIDHIIPRSKGGANRLDNYQPMCEPCNTEKGDGRDQF